MLQKARIGFIFPIILFLSLWLSSCRTARELSIANPSPITTSKLIKNVEQKGSDYKYLTIRRINCQYSDNDSKVNFRINLKALYNDKILVSISKLNIPAGKLLLTPDSVKYVNYIDKNYFFDDYSYLSKILNADLDFYIIQSIIANNTFSYYRNLIEDDLNSFETSVVDGQYVLQPGNLNDVAKNGSAAIVQKMYFDPKDLLLTRLSIDDEINSRKLEMDYADFVKVDKKFYPGSIDLSFISSISDVLLKIKMNGFSTEKIESFSFEIPERYEEIKVD